jgi:transposase-like protein
MAVRRHRRYSTEFKLRLVEAYLAASQARRTLPVFRNAARKARCGGFTWISGTEFFPLY